MWLKKVYEKQPLFSIDVEEIVEHPMFRGVFFKKCEKTNLCCITMGWDSSDCRVDFSMKYGKRVEFRDVKEERKKTKSLLLCNTKIFPSEFPTQEMDVKENSEEEKLLKEFIESIMSKYKNDVSGFISVHSIYT